MKRILFFALISILFISSCGTTVERVEPGTQPDLSGLWNAIDIRIVCDSLIRDMLSNPRIDQIIRDAGNRKPVIIVGRFRNESSEHIDTGIISEIMETAIFNSGRLDFVAPAGLRDEIRAERQSQQQNASQETVARMGREIGADFMLTGTVRSNVDRGANRTVRTYFVRAELTNIETNARVWLGDNNEITKIVNRPNNRL
ncbi:MAG: penicillin-binding protein activator LpoB [Treponema sp.]|nr:penicillin-binding protein activator LpoB [Treponema sp.]